MEISLLPPTWIVDRELVGSRKAQRCTLKPVDADTVTLVPDDKASNAILDSYIWSKEPKV